MTLDLLAGALICLFGYGALRMVPIIDDRYRLAYRWWVETQRIWCHTCGRRGRFFWHWHRKHVVGAP